MNKSNSGSGLAMPDELATIPCLFEPPGDGQEEAGMLELDVVALAAQPDSDPMPDYIQDMFEVAGVPRSMSAGESLSWFNGCKTSVKFESACAKVDVDSAWFELSIQHQSGRRQRLRCTRYGDLVAIEDSAGIDSNGLIQAAVATILLDFKAASSQLMVKH